MSKGDEDYDPMCDPDNPREVNFGEVSAAAYRIQSGIMKTPCLVSSTCTVWKTDIDKLPESIEQIFVWDGRGYRPRNKETRPTNLPVFKERGARNAILNLSPEAKQQGITAASLGNHSQGVSYHGKLLNVPVTVVMPSVAPLVKIEKCRSFGANVVIHGLNMGDAKFHAIKLAKQHNMTYINGYDHPDIIAGQGTIGLEILEQVPDVDAIIVPVGGGGLIAGITIAVKHLKPKVLIYGVETECCASMTGSLRTGKIVPYVITSTLADGLAVGVVGCNSFFNIKPLIDKMVVVTEDWTARAILRVVEQEKYVVEGGGAVSVAAVCAGLVPELEGKKVVCILSGGNIDTSVLSVCLDRGLVAEQRLVKFKVNIGSAPGSLAELCSRLASIGISIKDIAQEQAWLKGTIFSVRVKIICQTRGPEHVNELRTLISDNYQECYFLKEHVGTSVRYMSLTDSLENISKREL